LASKSFLKTMAILACIEAQCATVISAAGDKDPELSAMVLQVEVEAFSALKSWPGNTITTSEMKKIGRALIQFEKHFNNVRIQEYFSFGLALMDDLKRHIKDAGRLAAIRATYDAMNRVYAYLDPNLEAIDQHEAAAEAVKIWHNIFTETFGG